MSLPAYAGELKQLVIWVSSKKALGQWCEENFDRILRDAEIAEAARSLVAIYRRGENAGRAYDTLAALIAKETP